MDPVTQQAASADDTLWNILIGVAAFLAVTVVGWIKLEMAGLRRDHDSLDGRVDAAERGIAARAAFCAATSANVHAFMSRIEAKLDRVVEGRMGGNGDGDRQK